MNLEPDANRIAVAVNKYIEAGNTASDGELNAAAIMSIAISIKRIADAVTYQSGGDYNLFDYIKRIGEASR